MDDERKRFVGDWCIGYKTASQSALPAGRCRFSVFHASQLGKHVAKQCGRTSQPRSGRRLHWHSSRRPLCAQINFSVVGSLFRGRSQFQVMDIFFQLSEKSSTALSWKNNRLISFSWWHRLLDPLDVEEAFEFMEDLGDPCRRKILCHVHSFVPHAPAWLQTIFRVIRSSL